mmetsp:Transcript_51123/g.153620  ORF Transcript_51123/g.153620 Transcript_51123/m.153620 type:complete len:104 (-) Transcript_51123:169-480(-)
MVGCTQPWMAAMSVAKRVNEEVASAAKDKGKELTEKEKSEGYAGRGAAARITSHPRTYVSSRLLFFQDSTGGLRNSGRQAGTPDEFQQSTRPHDQLHDGTGGH